MLRTNLTTRLRIATAEQGRQAGINHGVLLFFWNTCHGGGDKIAWLDKSNNNSFEQEFLELAENFIAHLNSSCYTGISSYEFHYAIYEEGSFYKKHIDQFQSDNKRKFSFINYLNDDWIETDGGQLHLYQHEGVQKIQPESKTAVFFKSNEMEHEVVLCNRSRMSISGWLKSS